METHFVLLLVSVKFSFCHWVQLPSLSSSNQNGHKKHSTLLIQNVTRPSEGDCPDFHNLTVMSYGPRQKRWSSEPIKPSDGWEILFEDVQEVIRENERIPNTPTGKVEFVIHIGEKMMLETEKRIRSLFTAESREARTKAIHYPSMESALMTISMLLFGVYLSKLILRLLQSHYYKYNPNMLGMVGGIRAPIMIAQGRRRKRCRSSEMKELHLMYLIDKFNSQFN